VTNETCVDGSNRPYRRLGARESLGASGTRDAHIGHSGAQPEPVRTRLADEPEVANVSKVTEAFYRPVPQGRYLRKRQSKFSGGGDILHMVFPAREE
jgi:hypothetical protein